MTLYDAGLIAVLIGFAYLGIKHGSVWIAACLIGGFLGAFLVEYYRLPVAQMIGNFTGAEAIASVLLFFIGVLVAIIPGWLVSKAAGMFCVGALDKLLGILAGLLAGTIAVTLFFMIIVPRVPKIERSQAWKKSSMLRPLCENVEDFFSHPSARRASITDELREGVSEEMTPLVNKTTDAIKDTADKVGDTVAKKAKQAKRAVIGEK